MTTTMVIGSRMARCSHMT